MLQSTIFREIDNLARHINNTYENIFKKYGLQRGQFVFISRIVENKSINLKELAHAVRVDKTTVTKATQKLEEAGYITKQIDITDNRIIHLTPTDKCINIYESIIREKNDIINNIINKFPSKDVTSYIDMTRSLNEYLDSIEKSSKI